MLSLAQAVTRLAMLVASLIAVLSILVGSLIGFSRRIGDRYLGPVRTFAFAAAVAVVLGQFLPDALEGMGIVALGPFALGLAAPWLLERLTFRASRASQSLGLELGYVGLLVHQLGDGLGMGTYTGPTHAGHSHTDVFLAIGGHTVPVAAMVVVAFQRARGRGNAAFRAVGLAVAVVGGVALARFPGASLATDHHDFVSALVGGLLLHIATHDLRAELPNDTRTRVVDLAAAAVGLGVVVATSSGHDHDHEGAGLAVEVASRPHLFDAIASLATTTAAPLLAGLALAAFVQSFAGRPSAGWLSARSRTADAVRGALLGVPLPTCACGVLPVAQSLERTGATPALVAAFVFAAPALGIDTFLLTGRLIGWRVAAVRLSVVVVAAVLGGVALALATRGTSAHGHHPDSPLETTTGSLGVRFATHLDELAHHTLPWTLVGLFAAACVSVTVDGSLLARWSPLVVDLALVLAVALPSYVCATSGIPLAAVLLAKGFSPGAILIGLVVGPAVGLATMGWLSRAYGQRARAFAAVAFLVPVIAAGLAFDRFGAGESSLTRLGADSPGLVSIVALGALGLIAFATSFRRGVRGFFASLLDPVDSHAHGHAMHDHDAHCAPEHPHLHVHVDAASPHGSHDAACLGHDP